MASRGRNRVAIVGRCDPRLRDLIADVLRDLGVEISDAPVLGDPPAVVLAVAERANLTAVLDLAKAVAGRGPILAVVPLEDERLEHAAASQGAHACYTLGAPLGRLRALVAKLLGEKEPAAN